MQLLTNVKWSGDYQQAARALDATILSTPLDDRIPVVDCPLGAALQMIYNDEVLFDGFINSRPKSTAGGTITLSCYDRGFYLKRNKKLYQFRGTAAETAAAQVAGDFGITIGSLASTGIALDRDFLTGRETLYEVIATMYTLASQTTGKQYHIGFKADKLHITEKGPDEYTLIIRGKSNLMEATITESIEKMVNAVAIYGEDHKLITTEEDAALIAQYGRLQEVLIQSKADDKYAEARKLMANNGVSQRITVDCLGNVANITGGSVVVQEPYTGLYGLFYIDSDIHEWKRGQYYNKLVLNYNSIMDEKEAGSLPNADGSKTSSKKKSSSQDSNGLESWLLRD